MPTPEGRALSFQAQAATELLSERVGDIAASMLAAQVDYDPEKIRELADQYALLLSGAMLAVAAIRTGYLQAFSLAEGEPRIPIPASAAHPSIADVLVGQRNPQSAMYAAAANMRMWLDMQAQAIEDGIEDTAAYLGQQGPPNKVAGELLREYTESTLLSTSDFVDRTVLGPVRTVAALRRVAHPNACERCVRVSGVLVFKKNPSPRHPQCRCSFEPVYITDPAYTARLAQYTKNTTYRGAGGYPAATRRRGQQQLSAAQSRVNDEVLQGAWREYLKEEQVRLAARVKTIKSNTYQNWAVMVAVTQSEVGGDMLPVLTRD